MGKPNEVKNQFANVLRQSLIEHFGALPSNAIIAREFNLRATGTEPVTQESVRRWVRGISMPDEKKLKVLVTWLNLDLKTCFDLGLERPGQSLGRMNTPFFRQPEILKLLETLTKLNDAERKIIIRLARVIAKKNDVIHGSKSPPPPQDLICPQQS